MIFLCKSRSAWFFFLCHSKCAFTFSRPTLCDLCHSLCSVFIFLMNSCNSMTQLFQDFELWEELEVLMLELEEELLEVLLEDVVEAEEDDPFCHQWRFPFFLSSSSSSSSLSLFTFRACTHAVRATPRRSLHGSFFPGLANTVRGATTRRSANAYTLCRAERDNFIQKRGNDYKGSLIVSEICTMQTKWSLKIV